MATQFGLWKSRLWPSRASSSDGVAVQPKQQPILFRVAIVVCSGIAICIWITVSVAHTESIPRIIEPPPALLPDSQLPASIPCTSTFERRFECRARQDGEVMYFTMTSSSRLIVHTSISVRNQTLGNVIAAWGSPTNFARSGHAVYIYWGTRWVYLFTCTLEPTSEIEFIGYGVAYSSAANQRPSPWRGFPDTLCDGDGNSPQRP